MLFKKLSLSIAFAAALVACANGNISNDGTHQALSQPLENFGLPQAAISDDAVAPTISPRGRHSLRHVRRSAAFRRHTRRSNKKCSSDSVIASKSTKSGVVVSDDATDATDLTQSSNSTHSHTSESDNDGDGDDDDDGSDDDGSDSSSSSNSTVTSSAGSGNYKRVQQNRGSSFWSGNNWDFFTGSDPTKGSVSFQSQSSAQSQGLIGISNSTAYMRTSTKDLSQGQNRPSVRFQSKDAYDSGLVIFDVAKMPVGCATWPALWTTMGSTWPRNGEIDVVEGTGYESTSNKNQMTVHLGSNSPLSLKRRNERKRATSSEFVGKIVTGATNCNQYGATTGCAIYDSNSNGPSWGTDFNAAGGGIWAMQFGNGNGVKIWFWGRKSGKIPSELQSASVSPSKLDPTSWGTPMANFQTSLINSAIKKQNIIMDITIGGDWAGNVPMDGQCKGQSRSAALAKGSNYADAEFMINAIDVYCENGTC